MVPVLMLFVLAILLAARFLLPLSILQLLPAEPSLRPSVRAGMVPRVACLASWVPVVAALACRAPVRAGWQSIAKLEQRCLEVGQRF